MPERTVVVQKTVTELVCRECGKVIEGRYRRFSGMGETDICRSCATAQLERNNTVWCFEGRHEVPKADGLYTNEWSNDYDGPQCYDCRLMELLNSLCGYEDGSGRELLDHFGINEVVQRLRMTAGDRFLGVKGTFISSAALRKKDFDASTH